MNKEFEKVIFNDPVTVVMWSDNTKTIVKCMEGTEFDKWTGLSMAITKKALGDDYHHTFRKHCIKMVDTYDNDSVSAKENHKESTVKNKKDTKKTEEVKKEVKNEKVNKKNRSERPKSSFMKKVKGSKSYKEKKAED